MADGTSLPQQVPQAGWSVPYSFKMEKGVATMSGVGVGALVSFLFQTVLRGYHPS